jgi:putative flippase GtrA
MTQDTNLQRQAMYFVLIGGLATLTQLLFVFFFVSVCHFHPLIANILAFFLAFQVSFLGHRNLTFSRLHNEKKLRLLHFFTVAASAGLINESLYFILLHYTNLHYMIALFLVVGTVAVYNFILSKFWACR